MTTRLGVQATHTGELPWRTAGWGEELVRHTEGSGGNQASQTEQVKHRVSVRPSQLYGNL